MTSGARDHSVGGATLALRSLNGRELLEECLPSLVKAIRHRNHPDDEIIVGDDFSSDGTAEMLAEKFPSVKVIRMERHSGCPLTANRVIGAAKNEIVVMMDNDVKVEPDFIGPALAHFNDPAVFAVTMRARRWDMETFQSGGQVGRFRRGFLRAWENYDVPRPDESPLAAGRKLVSLYGIGAHVAYRKSMFLEIGGFDPLFSPYIWEDTEICYRAWKRGWKTMYEPRCNVYHKVHGSAAKLFKSDRMAQSSERNRLVFHWKMLADADLWFWHLLNLFFRTVLAVPTFNKLFLRSLFEAVTMLPEIQKKRENDRKHWVLSDREILAKPLETLMALKRERGEQ